MAKQTIDIGTTANDGTGTLLRDAFDMVNDNFTELYNDETTGEVNSITATAPISRDQAVGPVTLSLDDLGITTGKIADDAVTADKLANSINTAIAANTAKTGITSSQAADIVTNNAKNTDQTVTLSEGANVTITGTYPNFTIASDDVVGAVNSVNGQAGVVVLDTADISEDTNLYYTESRVTANSAVAANTAKLTANTTNVTSAGALMDSEVTNLADVKAFDSSDYLASSVTTITSGQASAIVTNTNKTGITSGQASAITANTAKVTNATHTGDVTGSGILTIVDDKVITSKILDANVTTAKIADANITVGKMAANSVDSDQYVDGSIDTIHIADDQVTFDKLEDRYTQLSALGSGTSFALNFSTAATFTATASNPATLTFSNAVQGQVIDLIITGNHALTFAETGATFNKVGSTSYAGGSTNLIQIICTDDSSGAKIYHYSIATYAAAQPQ